MVGRDSRQRGFTYLAVLFMVAIAGIGLAALGPMWSVMAKREKEKELLFVGDEFRKAIADYYERTPGTVKRYPAKLEELLKDNRHLSPLRHLRKIYVDPMTGTKDWGLVIGPDGGITAVYSKGEGAPLKSANFRDGNVGFAGAKTYADWKFGPSR